MGIRPKVTFYGNRQAGMIGYLTLRTIGYNITETWEDKNYGLPLPLNTPKIIIDDKIIPQKTADLLICVHGLRIVPEDILHRYRLGGINLHPFLDKYPGLSPVSRAIIDGEKEASVFAHKMTAKVDEGEIIAVAKTDMPATTNVIEVYNTLYPLYAKVLTEAVEAVC